MADLPLELPQVDRSEQTVAGWLVVSASPFFWVTVPLGLALGVLIVMTHFAGLLSLIGCVLMSSQPLTPGCDCFESSSFACCQLGSLQPCYTVARGAEAGFSAFTFLGTGLAMPAWLEGGCVH